MANGVVLTNGGEEWCAERIAGVQGAGTNNVASNNGTYIGAGTGTTTPAKSQTALVTEVGSRVGTSVTVTGNQAAAKYQATATWTFDASRSITEAALFSASSSGVMFVRAVFDAISGVTSDTIAFTFLIDPA